MKLFIRGLAIAAVVVASACSSAPKPTREDVEKSMRATWEHPASGATERTSIQFNQITFGKTYPANPQDVVDGVPPDSAVTAVLVDFTTRNHYSTRTYAVRRVREAKVYLDKFGQWAVMTGQARGQDEMKDEPAAP
jgi:hypothetical protein